MLQFIRVRYLAVAFVVLFAMGMAYQAMHTTQGVMSVARQEGTLSSAQYRAPIANLEAQLFEPAPLSMEQRIRLAAAVDDMRKALLAGGDSHMAKYSARELGTLAQMCRGLGDLEGADLDRVRQNWMRIRSNTFDDASWFRFSEGDPVAPAVEPRVLLSEADRANVERLKGTLDRIQQRIEWGEQEADRLGEPSPEGAVDDGVRDAWKDWAVGWEEHLTSLRSELSPAPEADASMRVRFAWDSANRALEELTAAPAGVASGGRPPYKVEWTRRFQNARRDLDSARSWIQKAEDGREV